MSLVTLYASAEPLAEGGRRPGVRGKAAFTLAEVLITLGIIGVVAAMTLPALIQKHQEQETVVRLKKVYTVLSQAMMLAVNEHGTADNWETYSYDAGVGVDPDEEGETTRFEVTNILKNLKLAKDCKYESAGCFIDGGYKQLNGSAERNFETLNNRYYKAILADGTAIAIEGYGSNIENLSNCGEIWVDVNGSKKPNVVGKDVFLFQYTKDRILPYEYKINNVPLSQTSCKLTSSGYACANWVLSAGNLDYLHCNDLSYVGKTKCSD